MKQAFLEGQRLYLRPLSEVDAEGEYPSWLNSAKVCAGNSHHLYPYSNKQAIEYIRQIQLSRTDLVLAIVQKNDDRHIGNIALQSINPIHRSAELSILIGDPDSWGLGYATEASQLICKQGFEALNLRRIGCGTYANNIGMQRVAIAIGMKKEGVRRQAIFKDGQYLDLIEYGLLRDEYKNPAESEKEP